MRDDFFDTTVPPSPGATVTYDSTISFDVGEVRVWDFNPETRILRVAANYRTIKHFIEAIGGLPADLMVPAMDGFTFRANNVVLITPTKNGSLLLDPYLDRIGRPSLEAKVIRFFRRILGME